MSRITRTAATLSACALVIVGLLGARPQPAAIRNIPQPRASRAAPERSEPQSPPSAALAAGSEPLSPQEWPQPWHPAPQTRPADPTEPDPFELPEGLLGVGDEDQLPPPAPEPTPEPTPAPLPGTGPSMAGQHVAQTERLDIYVGQSTFSPEQIAASAPLIERLLREDERRFGTALEHRVSLAFYRPSLAPGRGTRGIAYTDQGRAQVFYAPGESLDRAVVVVAHELAHHLQSQRYGEQVQRRADIIMLEGMATWIVGERWLGMYGADSWKHRAHQIRGAGVPLRLIGAERSGSNNAYELWASFVDFLVQRYGWERVDELYRSGRGRGAGSSDYQGVLGAPLDQLADDWRIWIDQ
jgi:hypothetical protein